MDRLATFLLGGAVGAALGYIASRKDQKKAYKTPECRTVEAPQPAPVASREEPALRVEASKMVTEVVRVETTEAAAEVEVEVEVIESPEAAETAVAETAVAEAAVAEAEKIVAEAAEAEIAEIGAEAAAAEAPAAEVPTVDMFGAEGPAAEEPAEEFAETLVEETSAPEVSVAEAAVPEAEEPAATVTEFVLETGPEAFATEAEPEIIEFWEPADMASEAPAEAVDMEAFEAPPTAAAGAETAAAISSVDDLKARIEETRRRIRQELERPFISPADIEDTTDWTVSPVVPVDGEATAVAAGIEEPAVEQQETMADAAAYSASPEEIAAEITAEYEGAIASKPVDYESVKSRIELTRSRLKAKAFDAMMTGESALLSWEPAGASKPQPATPAIDSEIDQTIETSLSEQDN